jgi:hypothetical protein
MKKRTVVVVIVTLLIAIVGALGAPSPVDLLREHENSVQEIITLIDKGDDEGALALLDSLHTAVIEARAKITGLFFSGQADTLTDPFSLSAGVYRVHFTTEGFGAVKVIILAGTDGDKLLFNLAPGDASEGASTFYRAQGSRIMIQFSNITAPYKLVFERIE